MTAPNPQSPLAPYAVHDKASRGRAHQEEGLPADESPFELDRYRILNCPAFRRLHKTQVFPVDAGDHFRTRLTHTLEVVAQAQRLARRLRLNDRLAGAVALAHDLGHPPFGHAGEHALDTLMEGHGGFEHNVQSLRVVDYLEHPYPDFRGLNLTFELRESLIKHHTRYDQPESAAAFHDQARPLLDAGPMPPLEGQVVNLADVIAYSLHDIEDGLVACGLSEETLRRSALWRQASAPVRKKHPSHRLHAIRRPILDNLARRLIDDAATESSRRIRQAAVTDPDAVRRSTSGLVAFSTELTTGIEELQDLLRQVVYHDKGVADKDAEARRLIHQIFEAYLARPDMLPERFSARIQQQGPHRVICDYVAGMTDRFCQQEHRRLLASNDH